MPRIAFTIPIMPGKQQECVRLLEKYKEELDQAHEAVGAVQWCKFVDRDEYVEFIDWEGRSFADLLRDYLSRPEMQEFLLVQLAVFRIYLLEDQRRQGRNDKHMPVGMKIIFPEIIK